MATALAEPDVRRVVLGYQSAVALVRARVLEFLASAWTALGRWDRVDIERFVAVIVPRVEAGQLVTASLTDAYLAQLERTVLGTTARAVGVSAASVSTEALRGVPAAEVYRRAGVTVWRSLADGVPYDQAVARGLDRAQTMAATDLQLAKTHTARRALQDNPRVVGFRRSLRGGSSCGLCVVASTQKYHKKQLSPLHPRCDCGIVTLFADKDPGQVINPDRLERVHELIDERFGAFNSGARSIPGVTKPNGQPLQYRDVLITHEHGELGPILAIRGQAWTGPDDI